MLNFSLRKTLIIFGICLLGVIVAILSVTPKGILPSWVPHPQINLGLDLQGGSYVLLQADKDAVIKERQENSRAAIQQALRSARIPYRSLIVRNDTITFSLIDATNVRSAREAIRDVINTRTGSSRDLLLYDVTETEGAFTFRMTEEGLRDLLMYMTDKATEIIRRRIDETGVREPVIARSGENRIIVELPGVNDPKQLKDLLGSTAKMTFRLVVEGQTTPDAETDILPYAERDLSTGQPASIAVRKKVEVDGATLTDAKSTFDDRSNEYVVSFRLDTIGARRFADVSRNHVNERFAIVLDNKVISAPVIREPILGGQGQISGGFNSNAEADQLAVLLRSGALPVPLEVIQDRVVGASLGADAIQAGLISVCAGFILVVCFMLIAYGHFGIYATIALVINLALTIAVLATVGATLTLPGIAGILLALGVAVDSNVLINERTREELKKGRGVIASLETGFSRAYTTIVDANVTTFLKMIILYAVATGTIRGFALTISLGLLISMFTAIELVRLLISRWIKKKRPKELNVGTKFRLLPEKTSIPFMKARYSGLVISATISLIAVVMMFVPGVKLGVDFAGGVVIEAKLEKEADLALIRKNLNNLEIGSVQVQQFGSPHDIMLRFEHKESSAERDAAVAAVHTELQKISPIQENGWGVSSLDAAVGSELFTQGMIALALASVVMFTYIAWRFEWPFGVGSITTMFLDITKTLGFYALTGFEFNLTSIAALLTIMGFSINDKIVVYDRVRENLKLYKTMPLQKLIDLSINETLARTLFTTISTLLAILPLVFFGGPALWEFAVVLVFGLILATSSSIFIAAPILLNLGEHRLRPNIPQNASASSQKTA